ncbi:hybrid sensor histidine kinase/response regulator [Alkalimarinus alittae]|uniref:histidine kinase n=1 Tax=Alkalimarinus alittae TaxID=2961619 RepID=A0ABY6N3N8_9ALTE|nr:PAS domain-containing hybrid sensor histidine kinase/response regulator [Alkalimarinus alittae]UZE96733.1 ATP-binding protein [Alkalimarinus alittae]
MAISIKKLIDWGVIPDIASSLKKCIRLCNASAITLGLGLVPYLFIYWHYELHRVFSTVLMLVLFNFSIPYLNKLGYIRFTRISFVMVNYSLGFLNSALLGQESFVYLYLIVGLPAAVMLFRYREYRLQAICLTSAVFFIVLDLVFNVEPLAVYLLSAEALGCIQISTVLGALSCSVVFILFFRHESDAAQRRFEQLVVSKQILNNDLDAVLFCGMDGQITFANQAAEKLYGYDQAELIGRKLESLYVTTQDSDALKPPLIEEAKSKQTNWRGEIALRKSNGCQFTALLTQFVVTDESGQSVGVAATAKDITQQKLTELALIEAKDNAEEAAKVKSNFLATMSHEIRTPLNGVIGMAQLLLEDNPKPEQIESLNILKFAGENLLALINDVLDFSKIDAGRITLETVPFCLAELIHSIKSSSKYLAFEKGIKFSVQLDDQLAQNYQGDPVRLTQILLNLTSNAIKFTKEGQVSLEVNVIKDEHDSADIEFKVSDSGIGIAKDKLEYIFEQFSQADNTITRHYGGSGLGLSITKGLLDAFGSEIQVESEEGKGTRFSFILAMQKTPEALLSRPSKYMNSRYHVQSDVGLDGLSILVAEDNPVNVMVIQKWLSKWGVEFDIAKNGQEAVQKINEKQYDLILMDIQMPVMDGFQATLAIRSLMKGAPLPIIALTATTTDEFVAEAYEVGMNDYLGKPFKPEHLKSKIKQLCYPAATPLS